MSGPLNLTGRHGHFLYSTGDIYTEQNEGSRGRSYSTPQRVVITSRALARDFSLRAEGQNNGG